MRNTAFVSSSIAAVISRSRSSSAQEYQCSRSHAVPLYGRPRSNSFNPFTWWSRSHHFPPGFRRSSSDFYTPRVSTLDGTLELEHGGNLTVHLVHSRISRLTSLSPRACAAISCSNGCVYAGSLVTRICLINPVFVGPITSRNGARGVGSLSF